MLNTFGADITFYFETYNKNIKFRKLICNINFHFLLFHVSAKQNEHGDFEYVSYLFGRLIIFPAHSVAQAVNFKPLISGYWTSKINGITFLGKWSFVMMFPY